MDKIEKLEQKIQEFESRIKFLEMTPYPDFVSPIEKLREEMKKFTLDRIEKQDDNFLSELKVIFDYLNEDAGLTDENGFPLGNFDLSNEIPSIRSIENKINHRIDPNKELGNMLEHLEFLKINLAPLGENQEISYTNGQINGLNSATNMIKYLIEKIKNKYF